MDTQIKSFFLSPTPQYLTLSPLFYLSCKQSLSDLMFSIIFCAKNSLVHNSKLDHIDELKTPIFQGIGCLHISSCPNKHHPPSLSLNLFIFLHVFLFFLIYTHSVCNLRIQPSSLTPFCTSNLITHYVL